MANRITVSICGDDYTLMAEESPSYMQKVAAMVDAEMGEIMHCPGRDFFCLGDALSVVMSDPWYLYCLTISLAVKSDCITLTGSIA